MMGKFFIVQVLLLGLAISAQYGTAEETTIAADMAISPSTTSAEKYTGRLNRIEKFKKNYNAIQSELRQLKARNTKASARYNEIIATNKKPFPNVGNLLNENQDVISIKDDLDQRFPDFWKVAQRKECEKLFGKLLSQFSKGVYRAISDDFSHWKMSIEFNVNTTQKELNAEENKLARDYDVRQKTCEETGIGCDNFAVPHWIPEYIKEVEDKLDDNFEKNFKDVVAYSVKKKLKSELITPVQACLDE